MNSPTETKQQYEGAILQQLIKNAEELAVIQFKLERDLPKLDKIDVLEQKMNTFQKELSEVKEITNQIKSLLGWLKWIGGALFAIALSLIANFVYSSVG